MFPLIYLCICGLHSGSMCAEVCSQLKYALVEPRVFSPDDVYKLSADCEDETSLSFFSLTGCRFTNILKHSGLKCDRCSKKDKMFIRTRATRKHTVNQIVGILCSRQFL